MKLKIFIIWGALLLALLVLYVCQREPALSITFGGDIILAREGEALFVEDPWGGFAVPAGNGGNTAADTLFFANLESPLGETEHLNKASVNGYDLCAGVEQAGLLVTGGINLVSIANNHQGDCGEGDSTRKTLVEHSIPSVGNNFTPVYLDTTAGRVGVIAADDITGAVNEDALVEQVTAAREQCVILIVSLHWGNEYQAGPTQHQRDLAQRLADAGVDVLWGHHPHVLQPVEWVAASTGERKMLVMYSLGNLLTDQWMTQDTQRSALITLYFNGGRIESISAQPIRMDWATRSLVTPNLDEINKIEERLGLENLSGISVIQPGNGDQK